MLVLTRKLRESIIIGDDIRITVVDIRGKQVKVAIEAPREVSVHRAEVFDRIQHENGNGLPNAAGTGNGHVPPGYPPSPDLRYRRGPRAL